MRNNIIIKFLLVLIMAITVLILFIKLLENSKEKNNVQERYILKASNGTVALFLGEDVVETYDIEIETLPYSDRQSLEEGIIYKNIEEAQSAIEDYDG